jgi:Negative regulator of sigma F
MRDTDRLIEDLAQQAKPVKPLANPLLRASALLAGLLAVMAALAMYGGDIAGTLAHLSHMPFSLELGGALFAGVGAIIAAVMLSVPGRAPEWIYLPLPGVSLWLAGGSLECYRQVVEGYTIASIFASSDCFTFILTAGMPAAATSYFFLRHHLAIGAARVTALASLGSALLATTLLQFVHAHGTNPVDFVTHVVTVALLMLLATMLARFEPRQL